MTEPSAFIPPLPLRYITPPGWAAVALADPAALLSDHAHCEKKAAINALNLSLALTDWPRASVLLARLAEDELNHFRRVLEALQSFGWPLRPEGGNAYAQGLHKLSAKGLLDRLLMGALIEARSCERLWLMEQAGGAHAELGTEPWLAFLLELERCEAGHAVGYRSLALERFGPEAEARLDWWLDREAEVISALPWTSSVH